MSEELTTYAGRGINDMPPQILRSVVHEMVAEANYVMGAGIEDDEFVKMTRWLISYLGEKHGYLPLNHVRTAIRQGSLGQRGGTSKLIPRNLVIWLSEQDKLYQEQHAADLRKNDEIKRDTEMNCQKAHSLVATAVRMKVSWLADKMITSEEYDSFSSKAIYDLLESGVSEKDIRPRHVLPGQRKEALI